MVAALGGGVVGTSVGSGVVDGVTEGASEAPESVSEPTVVGSVGLCVVDANLWTAFEVVGPDVGSLKCSL